jgi:hypothetical protein
MGLEAKHAIKQVDRLLSNSGVTVWSWFTHWVRFVVAARQEIVVALDWTEFDKDAHATIAMYLVTSHGRATPLLWKTVEKSALKNRRNDYEAELIERLHEILPSHSELELRGAVEHLAQVVAIALSCARGARASRGALLSPSLCIFR